MFFTTKPNMRELNFNYSPNTLQVIIGVLMYKIKTKLNEYCKNYLQLFNLDKFIYFLLFEKRSFFILEFTKLHTSLLLYSDWINYKYIRIFFKSKSILIKFKNKLDLELNANLDNVFKVQNNYKYNFVNDQERLMSLD